ncbi:hypothetical protein P3T24_006492 [Paraburkholderia sp. GAS33]
MIACGQCGGLALGSGATLILLAAPESSANLVFQRSQSYQ